MRTSSKKNPKKLMKEKMKEMEEAVKDLDFESAAILRDEIKKSSLSRTGGVARESLQCR
jgi:protein-arginine kinase activator protein McsA